MSTSLPASDELQLSMPTWSARAPMLELKLDVDVDGVEVDVVPERPDRPEHAI